ncbi:MAG TPA: hypothetical protein VLG13_02540 [Patescibacteria group bacterium]|nr:hypothetical protein [Patescibacteria group bacterium]
MDRKGNLVNFDKGEQKKWESFRLSPTVTVDTALQIVDDFNSQATTYEGRAEALVGRTDREAQAVRGGFIYKANELRAFAVVIQKTCGEVSAVDQFIETIGD